MNQVKTSEVARAFNKLQVEQIECKHHVRGFVVVDGVRIFPVHFSRGRKELPMSVGHLLRKSLYLTDEEFRNLIGCSLSREAYFDILRNKGLIGVAAEQG